MKPCDKCSYEWHDPKNNCSCRDQCEEYKKWYATTTRVEGLDMFAKAVKGDSNDSRP